MRGLIVKDFLILRKYILSIGVMALLYIVVFGAMGAVVFVSVFCSILCGSILSSTLVYDHQAGWDGYALALPVTRRQIVAAKYGTLLFFCLVGFLLSLACTLVYSLVQADAEPLGSLLSLPLLGLDGALLIGAVLLPLLIRFGTERGRLILALVAAAGGGALAGSSIAFEPGGDAAASSVNLLPLWLLPAALVITYLSYRLAALLYSRKDF